MPEYDPDNEPITRQPAQRSAGVIPLLCGALAAGSCCLIILGILYLIGGN